MSFKLDSSPRYVRVTFRDNDGKRRQWTGHVRLDGELLRGEYRTDDLSVPHVEGQFPYRLHLLIVPVERVVKVERQDPVYEEWVKLDGWQ